MKKPSLAIVIGMGKKPKMGAEEEPEDGTEYAYSDDQLAMAKELIAAVKAGEERAVLEALHGLVMSYESSEEGEM